MELFATWRTPFVAITVIVISLLCYRRLRARFIAPDAPDFIRFLWAVMYTSAAAALLSLVAVLAGWDDGLLTLLFGLPVGIASPIIVGHTFWTAWKRGAFRTPT